MPLSVDNIIQANTGSFDGATDSVTLPAGTTAGSTVVVFVSFGSPTGTAYSVAVANHTQVGGVVGANSTDKVVPSIWARRNVPADETSWTLTVSPSGTQVVWVALEVTGIGLDPLNSWFETVSFAQINYDGGTPSTIWTDLSPQTSCYDVLALALFASRSADTTPVTFSGHTDGFTELAEVSQVNATNATSMSVAYLPGLALDVFESTATLSTGAPATATVIVFYADGAKHAQNFDAMFGAEIGTADSWANGSINSPSKIWDTVAGTPAVTTTTARKYGDGVGGAYCMELSTIAGAENVEWTSGGILSIYPPITGYPVVARFCVRFPTILPVADTELASVDAGGTATMTIWYRSASQKLGVKIGTGTEVLSDATVAADTWPAVDFRYDPRVTAHLCDWQVDYDSLDATGPVAQTQAVGASTSVNDVTAVRFGWHNARTATVRYDDIAMGKSWGMYPIGDLAIVSLGPDPSGTPTIGRVGGTGDSANFKVMTSNGSMATWDAAGARNAVDENPPTIGGSSDGIAQVAFTSGQYDYAEIPMAVFTAAPDYCLRALRWYIAPWAATGTAANFGLRSYDGTDELMLFINADHGADNSATLWLTRMQRDFSNNPGAYYQLTQGKVDGMALRFGFSTDAAPDVAIHNARAELAIAPVIVYGVAEAANGAMLYVRQDPASAAVVSLLGTTTPSGGITMTFTIDGVEGTQPIGTNTTGETSIGAESILGVTAYGLSPA